VTSRPIRKPLSLALLIAAIVGCSSAQAPATQEAEVVEARQENFKQMKAANDAIKKEAEETSPDPAVFRQNAAILIEHAAKITGGFPEGSGPEAGVETDALPAIWQRSAEFHAKANKMQQVLQQFSARATGNDIHATVAGVKLVGDACRECHQQFRQQD
jgi:cytochrome c556